MKWPDYSGLPDRPLLTFLKFMANIVDGPVTYFKENIALPIQAKNKQYYYHRRYRRVPTIDECYTDDQVCIWEANQQFIRDRQVENAIVEIMRQRTLECEMYYDLEDAEKYCTKVRAEYREAESNRFEKYGDIGYKAHVVQVYMKQKHKLVWERRHGKVGSGMLKPDGTRTDSGLSGQAVYLGDFCRKDQKYAKDVKEWI